MIVRISLLSTLFILICACGTSQGPKYTDGLYTPSFTYNKLSDTDRTKLGAEIKAKYEKLLGNRGFSGQILVAKNGEILFEDYKGFANLKTGKKIDATTPIHLASVSKVLTATAILRLVQQDNITLDQKVTDWLPKFPYKSTTIRTLLNHRSGLQHYANFPGLMKKNWNRKKIAEFTGSKYNKWVGPNPQNADNFKVDSVYKDVKFIVLQSGDVFPTEIEFYGSYKRVDNKSGQKSQKSSLKHFFGVNAFEWDFVDSNF